MLHNAHFDGTFAGWREAARQLLQLDVQPHRVNWLCGQSGPGLFDEQPTPAEPVRSARPIHIPRQLLALLESAACFRVDDRWALLYRILWRVAHGERVAMLAGDIDGSELHKRIKAVRREAHHLHAFLRFRTRDPAAGAPAFVAWHEPAHDILEMASGHFAERMGLNTWLIATPEAAALWDGQHMTILRPCPVPLMELARSQEDPGEALWMAYYSSTFNPSRLNRNVLENNMPVRFWKHLPEGPLIPKLMSEARAGAQLDGQADSVARQPGKAIRATRREA